LRAGQQADAGHGERRPRCLRTGRPGPDPRRGRLPRLAGTPAHPPRVWIRQLAAALRGAERQEGRDQGLPRSSPRMRVAPRRAKGPSSSGGLPAAAHPAPLSVPAETCTDYARSSRLEWLVANGTGAFAMGTVAGANTRRYHGHLVASLQPPVERMVTLARLEETVLAAGGDQPLSVNQYPGTLHPDGYRRLAGFRLAPDPIWSWTVDAVEIEKRLTLVPGEQTVLIHYRSSAPARLRIEPLLAFRDYH